jgi:hypothetical protein
MPMIVKLLNRLMWLALIICGTITVIAAVMFAITANSPTLLVLEIDTLTWGIFLGIFLALTVTVWVCIRLLTIPPGKRQVRKATPAAVAKSRLVQFTGPMRPAILPDTAVHPVNPEILNDTRPGPPAPTDEGIDEALNEASEYHGNKIPFELLEAEILDDTSPNEITPPGAVSDTTPHPKPIWEQYEAMFPPAEPGDEDFLELEQEIAGMMPTMGMRLDSIAAIPSNDSDEAEQHTSETPPDDGQGGGISSDDELTEDLPAPRPPDSLPT